MAQCVVWIEGVDFSETLFDTQKLSVIRGASRAYEEMPPLARHELCTALKGVKILRVAAGASQAGFLVSTDQTQAAKKLEPLLDRLKAWGREPKSVEPVVNDRAAPLEDHAPFAHLRFHHAIVEVQGDSEKAKEDAIEQARASIRVKQLTEPGLRERFSADPSPPANAPKGYDGTRAEAAITKGSPCAFDRRRPAEVIVLGPPTSDDEERQNYSPIPVSRSSGARWQFGRALRQRLYETAEAEIAAAWWRRLEQPDLVFTDDFHEMVAKPQPRIAKSDGSGEMQDLPPSLESKIAVFVADGDKFGKLRNDLNGMLGPVAGRVCMTNVLAARMNELLAGLVTDLAFLRDHEDENCVNAAALRLDDPVRKHLWSGRGRKPSDRLLRFETLLFGGDDLTFVVPAWLGWWLAVAFFKRTKDWKITRKEAKEACALADAPFPDNFAEQDLRFSAGLVFASYKAPIRTLKRLALEDLCHVAKTAEGGLEIEVLESIEPPPGGSGELRDRLLGKAWNTRTIHHAGGAETQGSRLVLPRDKVGACFNALAGYWTGPKPFPASQAHGALRKARQAGDLAGDPVARDAEKDRAARAAEKELREHRERMEETRDPLTDTEILPWAGGDARALRLFFLLQQRDYVAAAKPWIDAIDKREGNAP